MQILQWLFKGPHERERQSIKREEDINVQNSKGKDIILLDHHGTCRRARRNEERKVRFKNLKIFAFISRKDIPKACFYSSLSLKRLGSLNRRMHLEYSMMKMKREETSIGIGIAKNKIESGDHARNKVLPITEASFSSPETKVEAKGGRRKPVSRMKELIRWAAASKTEKAGKFNGQEVLQFRRRGTIEEDEEEKEVGGSPKFRFRWSMETCSTTCSSNIAEKSQSPNAGHITGTEGNWITTDSEFVVLEL